MAAAWEAERHPAGKRKRGRLACVSCRTRKQRCDGAQPRCSYCSQHDIECVFESASKKAEVSELYVHRMQNRVKYLESELEAARAVVLRRSFTDPTSPAGAQALAHVDAASFNAELFTGNSPMNFASTSHGGYLHAGQHAVSDVDCGVSASPTAANRSEKGRLGKTSTPTFVKSFFDEQHTEPGSTDLNDDNMYDDNVFDNTHLDLQLNTWPQRSAADVLVDYYMEYCYPQYPFIHGPTFRKRYEALWSSKTPLSKHFAGSVNIIFALGSAFSGDMPASMGQGFFQRAKSLIEPTILEAATLDALQALILLSLYLQSTNSLTHSWNIIGLAVHVAQSLELHKDAKSKRAMSLVQYETRKRAWWACYLLDSVSCIQLGRPHTIRDRDMTVDLPACVDDEFLSESIQRDEPHYYQSASSQPASKPSQLCFFVATIKLCQFMRDVHLVYDHAGDQSQFLEIDQRICDWVGALPLHLRPGELPSTDRILWSQKEVLTARILHLRLLLHRPAIIQRSQDSVPSSSPFVSIKPAAKAQVLSLRADACVDLAVSLIKHISEFYAQGLNSAWWYDLNYLFSAASVLVVHGSFGSAESTIFESIQTAIRLIGGMRDRGKILASSYLRKLEILYQQVFPRGHDPGHITVTLQNSDKASYRRAPNSSMQQSGEDSPLNWPIFNSTDAYLEKISFPWTFSDEYSVDMDKTG